jgi:hypothetical protein
MHDEIIRLFPPESAQTNHNSQPEASEMAPDNTKLVNLLIHLINGLSIIAIGLQIIGIVLRVFDM